MERHIVVVPNDILSAVVANFAAEAEESLGNTPHTLDVSVLDLLNLGCSPRLVLDRAHSIHCGARMNSAKNCPLYECVIAK